MSEYQMPVLSEQRKEELREYCEAVLEGGNNGSLMGDVYQIALASITAKLVAITDKSEVNGLSEDGWVGNFLAPDFRGIDVGCEIYLYTAPPVPVKHEGEK